MLKANFWILEVNWIRNGELAVKHDATKIGKYDRHRRELVATHGNAIAILTIFRAMDM